MKHGVLIIAHQYLDHLTDLIKTFDQDFYIYLHIDKRSKFSRAAISSLREIPNVKFVSQELKVNWGAMNHLNCILLLCKEALKSNDLDYFHVISGQDYPIKGLDFIKNFFENNPGDYLDYFEVLNSECEAEWLNRLLYYGFYEYVNSRSFLGNKILNGLILLQKKLGFSRALPNIKLYGGNGWWSLSRASVKHVMDTTDRDPSLLKRLRFTFCADEIYFQTILMNSPLRDKVMNNNLRFIDWTIRNGNRPANLDESDFNSLAGSDKIFARKFDFPVSEKLKQTIKENLLK